MHKSCFGQIASRTSSFDVFELFQISFLSSYCKAAVTQQGKLTKEILTSWTYLTTEKCLCIFNYMTQLNKTIVKSIPFGLKYMQNMIFSALSEQNTKTFWTLTKKIIGCVCAQLERSDRPLHVSTTCDYKKKVMNCAIFKTSNSNHKPTGKFVGQIQTYSH